MNLTDRPPGSVDLRVAYTKYRAVLSTQSTIIRMSGDESWTLRKPKAEEVIEIFVSKTIYHDKYKTLFPLANDYPLLKKWLENDAGAPSNVEVFGEEKSVFTFKDLTRFLERVKVEKQGEEELEVVVEKSKKRKAKGSISEQKKKKKGKGKAKETDSETSDTE